MFGLIIAAVVAAVQPTPVSATSEAPRIVVEGFGSVRTPPNLSRLSYEVQGEGQASDQAVSQLVAKATAIENALRSMDPAVDLRSNSVRVVAVRGSDCKEDRYNEQARLSTGPCAIAGYVASQSFSVRTGHVSDAGTMVGMAARHGASKPEIDGFDLMDSREAKRQAIAAALVEARTKAQAIADAENARLGQLVSVSLDGARSEDLIITSQEVKIMPNLESASPITVKVTPGPVETTARVRVTYAITN